MENIRVVIDSGEKQKRAFGRDITNVGPFISLDHGQNVTSRHLASLSISGETDQSNQSCPNSTTSQCSSNAVNSNITRKRPICEIPLENEGQPEKLKKRRTTGHEKKDLLRTKKRLFERVKEINTRQLEFLDVSVRVEFIIKKKNGELVECDRSWEALRPESEECLSTQFLNLENFPSDLKIKQAHPNLRQLDERLKVLMK